MRRRFPGLGRGSSIGPTRIELEEVRRQRREATPEERILWAAIRNQQIGFKFRNRHIVEGLLVDFYAPSVRVAVEVDGPIHEGREEYDAERTRVLESLGVEVIRFTNAEIRNDRSRVLAAIAAVCHRRAEAGFVVR